MQYPGYPPHPGYPPPPVIIDLGARSRKRTVTGLITCLVLGVIALLAALTGQINGGTGTTIGVAVLGAVFLLLGLAMLALLGRASRPRRLLFEPAGIRLDDPRGRPWALRWEELGAVRVSRTSPRVVTIPEAVVGPRVTVRLDLFPVSEQVRAYHPELTPFVHGPGYRLLLGDSPDWISMVEDGVRRYRPHLWRGILDEGFMVGLS